MGWERPLLSLLSFCVINKKRSPPVEGWVMALGARAAHSLSRGEQRGLIELLNLDTLLGLLPSISEVD